MIMSPASRRFADTAYFAMAMFSAALEIEYAVACCDSISMTYCGEPIVEDTTRTFLVWPLSKRGRKALIVWTAPIVFALNLVFRERRERFALKKLFSLYCEEGTYRNYHVVLEIFRVSTRRWPVSSV